jgi:hypothetical protein
MVVNEVQMEEVHGVSQEIPPQLQASYQLHQRLEMAGAYDRLKQIDPRRATLLAMYLTTEKNVKEIGEETGFRSRTRAQECLYSSINIAFFALPEQERAEYGNNPATALQTRSTVQTQTKSEKISKTLTKAPQEQHSANDGFPEPPTTEMPARQ